MKKGVDLIIGTPGRVIDLQEGGNLDLSNANFCVIDEADRMFDMGFYPDLRKILKCLPEAEKRQTMLFSATLNSYVKNLAWEYTRDPVEITIEAENITVSEIDQELLHVSSDEKMKLLIGILKHEHPQSAIIFCNTKRTCEVVSKRLNMNDLKSDFLIGDLPQAKRLQLIKSFKAGNVSILVATDVAARGIDIDDLAMVINFDLPVEAENYVHRIGRTARAGKSGKAYTFCSEQDVYNLPAIERYIEMSIPATVAYPEQMEEDKSAGIFIKTENWRGDDDYDNHRGYSKGHGHDKRGGYNKGGNYNNKGAKDNYGKKAGEYKKGGKGSNNNYKKPRIDPEKLANLTYEERMKLYKETYATPVKNNNTKGNNNSKNGGNKNRKPNQGKNTNSQKRYNNNNNYKGGKSSYNNKNNNYKNGNKKPYNNTKNNNKKGGLKQATTQKKTLWQKVKAFFGGKK